jgi:UDP-N-acetylmuramyl tripeptide synthase
LRRGLAVGGVDAALITNVTPDHLGEHGVLDLATLVDAKAVVGHAVNERGRVVLGADDPELVRIAPTFHATRVWFAATPESARAPLARGETTFLVERGAIVRAHRGKRTTLGKIVDMPITSGGTAPHNVKNALAAAALAWSLGLPDAAIRKGLRTFGRAPADNVGRGQIHTTASGVRVILDFGHNPGAARELYAWARALAGDANVLAVLTQPGDRDDAAMAAFAHEAATSGVSRAIVWEKDSLRRGRRAGSIARTLRRALGTSLPADRVSVAVDEASAIRAALAVADDGDVVVVSPSLDRVLPG